MACGHRRAAWRSRARCDRTRRRPAARPSSTKQPPSERERRGGRGVRAVDGGLAEGGAGLGDTAELELRPAEAEVGLVRRVA